ncbi:hypothetical protein BDR03DRAFT_1008440, partial [Suillus americanus]
MDYVFPANNFDSNGNFVTTAPTMDYGFPANSLDSNFAPPPSNGINWDDPALYTMSKAPELPAHSSLPDPPSPRLPAYSSLPDPPSPHPSETSTSDQFPLSPTYAGPLREANTSTWATHNPTRPVIRPRTPPPRLTDAQKASQKIKRDQKKEAMKCLHD